MPDANWDIAIGGDRVSAALDRADESRRIVFVCAHGAGGNMSDKGILAVTRAIRAKGIDTVRFNFIYSQKRAGGPDPMPKCMSVISAVVDRVRTELRPSMLIFGGRSMGGRAASMLAAEGFRADRLLL